MHNAISLDALRVLQAIDEKGSFAAAAEVLFKVPSALTYTVKKIESELGVTLFDRRGQRAVLTDAGRLVLREGKEILLATERLQERVRQIETGWETRLVIAKDTIISDSLLFDVIHQFCQLDKQIDIQVVEEALGGGWDALYSERADLAIGVSGDLPKGQFDITEMGELSFVFAVAANHPLADFVGLLESKQISEYPAIIVSDSSRNLPERSVGLFDAKQQIRVPTMAAKIDAQRKGLGVGFLPLHLARPLLESGELVAKGTSLHRPPMSVYFASRKDKPGKALAWFKEHLTQPDWFG